MIPNDAYVMIIGAMKCATTSLFSYLDAHPAICTAADKEPEFFSENQSHGLFATRYPELWSFDRRVHRYALEASTGYTKFPAEPNVARNICDYGLWPYFIYIVRNPFDRIASHFNSLHDSSLCDSASECEHMIINSHLIEISSYHLQLSQYRRYFTDERICVIDFDDLTRQPESVLKRVYDFLDLSPHYFPRKYKVRNATRFNRGAGSKILRWFWQDSSQDTYKSTLTANDRTRIHVALAPDMYRLQRDFGVDVARWGF